MRPSILYINGGDEILFRTFLPRKILKKLSCWKIIYFFYTHLAMKKVSADAVTQRIQNFSRKIKKKSENFRNGSENSKNFLEKFQKCCKFYDLDIPGIKKWC